MWESDGLNIVNNTPVLTTASKWWVCWLVFELQLASTFTQNYIGRLKKTTSYTSDQDNNNINKNSSNNTVTNYVVNDKHIGTLILSKSINNNKELHVSSLILNNRVVSSAIVETNTVRPADQRPFRSTRNYEALQEVVAVKVEHPSSSQRVVVTLSTSTEGCCRDVTLAGPMTPHTPPVEALPGLAVLVLVVAVVLATLGLVTCVVSHYRAGGGGLGGRARSWLSEHPPPGPASTAPMLALQPGMERLSHELRDRQVRLHSVSTDLELDLPPNIALPDGEEIPYGSSTRLQIRDPEQESEIYQKCIRPPPNRTVFDGESPPPYRSSSAGLLALGGSGDWSSSSSVTHVVRCHSLSSSGGTVRHHNHHIPTVIVPARTRRLSAFSDPPVSTPAGGTLAGLTMVPCQTEGGTTPSGSGGPV